MGIESMRRFSWLAIVLLLAPAAALSAQDGRQASRDVAKKWQGAIVNVRVSLKVRMSVGGREVQSMDDTVEAVATVIDPSGLTVMSLTSRQRCSKNWSTRLQDDPSGRSRTAFRRVSRA